MIVLIKYVVLLLLHMAHLYTAQTAICR